MHAQIDPRPDLRTPRRPPSVAASDRGRTFFGGCCRDLSPSRLPGTPSHAFGELPVRPGTCKERPRRYPQRPPVRPMIRCIFVLLAFAVLTLVLLPFQLLGIAFRLPIQRGIPWLFHRVLCALIGVR